MHLIQNTKLIIDILVELFYFNLVSKFQLYVLGEDVFVLGHGVFEDRHLPSWSVTKGVISRVISVNSVPVIIQVIIYI